MRVWGVNKDLKTEVQAISGTVDDLEWSDDGQRIVAGGDGRGKIVKARPSIPQPTSPPYPPSSQPSS